MTTPLQSFVFFENYFPAPIVKEFKTTVEGISIEIYGTAEEEAIEEIKTALKEYFNVSKDKIQDENLFLLCDFEKMQASSKDANALLELTQQKRETLEQICARRSVKIVFHENGETIILGAPNPQ